jgi:pimeloyl-ACP methyl ester carboxylesterase
MILESQVFIGPFESEVLVLIHGMGSAATAWKLTIPELTRHVTVITLDLPGHGKTPMSISQAMDPRSLADAVCETMTHLGVEKFHVCGNSLGGWVGLEVAAKHSGRVLSVTGLAPAGLWLAPYTARYPGTALLRAIAKTTRPLTPIALRFEWGRKLGFADVTPLWRNLSYETCFDASLAMASATGYFPAWDGMLKKRFDSLIPESIPITIIFGDTDNTLPASNCQERSVVPTHSKWYVIENCGHAPMWDHPTTVTRHILETTQSRS